MFPLFIGHAGEEIHLGDICCRGPGGYIFKANTGKKMNKFKVGDKVQYHSVGDWESYCYEVFVADEDAHGDIVVKSHGRYHVVNKDFYKLVPVKKKAWTIIFKPRSGNHPCSETYIDPYFKDVAVGNFGNRVIKVVEFEYEE